jgi:UDP-N-acetyl-D-mannosaminuronate dehydrogenase
MVAHLHASVAEITIHDPWVRQFQGDIYQLADRAHALILMVKHNAYRNLDLARLKEIMRVPLIIDGRGFFEPEQVEAAGFIYRGVGRGA